VRADRVGLVRAPQRRHQARAVRRIHRAGQMAPIDGIRDLIHPGVLSYNNTTNNNKCDVREAAQVRRRLCIKKASTANRWFPAPIGLNRFLPYNKYNGRVSLFCDILFYPFLPMDNSRSSSASSSGFSFVIKVPPRTQQLLQQQRQQYQHPNSPPPINNFTIGHNPGSTQSVGSPPQGLAQSGYLFRS